MSHQLHGLSLGILGVTKMILVPCSDHTPLFSLPRTCFSYLFLSTSLPLRRVREDMCMGLKTISNPGVIHHHLCKEPHHLRCQISPCPTFSTYLIYSVYLLHLQLTGIETTRKEGFYLLCLVLYPQHHGQMSNKCMTMQISHSIVY